MGINIDSVKERVFFADDILKKDQWICLQQPKIDTVQYSRGGEVLHRGYYCPSMIFDIIVGGANRGKLLKRFKKPPTYSYGFDQVGDLVTATNHDAKTEEIIWREDGIEVGITFEAVGPHDKMVSRISLAEYDAGNIRTYVLCDCDPYSRKIDSVYGEIYEYNCGSLQRVYCTESVGGIDHFNKDALAQLKTQIHEFLIEFEHDDNGYLKTYQIMDLTTSVYKEYPVLLKRRI